MSIELKTKRILRANVVVYTATAGGVVACVAAARAGATVILLEPGRHVGGMLSGGLGNSDVHGQESLVGGLALEVYHRMATYYGVKSAQDAFAFEPHVAEETLIEMLREAGVQVEFETQIVSVQKDGARITSLTMANGELVEGEVFIDASYEGDLMAKSGVSFTVGRESRSQYGEWLGGRMELLPGNHQFKFAVSPWRDGKLLPFVTPQSDLVATGEADKKFQSYGYRLCLTDRPKNQISITKPADYDPGDYELLRRYFKAGGEAIEGVMGVALLPNGKSDVNSHGPVSFNLLGAQFDYPEASNERRAEVVKRHLDWAKGMMWFLQNDPAVPKGHREFANRWALCKDEFTDTGGWPHQLYVREARRMLGANVVTQHDLEACRTKPDSIGMGGYNIDIREVQWVSVRTFHFPKAGDEVYMEGYVSQPVKPWQIPYSALTPKQSECTNLLVPVCASMSTVAFASFRMEPGFMIAGHAAGAAAAMASLHGRAVQDVSVRDLQARLRTDGQILDEPAD